MLSGISACRDSTRAQSGERGGVGSERGAEGKARPWESQGQSGKAREGWSWRRTEPEEWSMGGRELKEPWGIRGK